MKCIECGKKIIEKAILFIKKATKYAHCGAPGKLYNTRVATFFKPGEVYTRDGIHAKVGGSKQHYLPAEDGGVERYV